MNKEKEVCESSLLENGAMLKKLKSFTFEGNHFTKANLGLRLQIRNSILTEIVVQVRSIKSPCTLEL